ncbi:MAG: PucR family transcriptional regulator ligand-binding domain-containing protein [Actinomycetota bacterium]
MILRELLAEAHLHLRLLCGEDEQLDRPVRWVFATELAQPRRYLTGGELVISGLIWRKKPADSEAFVMALAEAGAVALAAGAAHLGGVPKDVVAACRRHGLALVEVPMEVSFGALSEHVLTSLSTVRSAQLAASLDRHRHLLLAVAEGRQLGELVSDVSKATGVSCRVLTSIGTHVVQGPKPLPGPDLDRVTAAFLAAERFPAVVAGQDVTAYTVLPVGSALGQRLTSWFLVAEGTWGDWDPDVTDALGELGAIAALEQARTSDARRFDRQRADELFALIEAGAGGQPEAATRLRQAGLEPDLPLLVVDAGFAGHPELVEVACCLLADLATYLGVPAVVAARPPWATLVLPGADGATEEIRQVMNRLLPGLPPSRLVLGTARAENQGVLAGALEGARHAAATAELDRSANLSVVSSDEEVSYARLLAAVPDEVRHMFASRVLGRLLEYDEAHQTGLLETLRTFLAQSGSWTRTAGELFLHVNTVRYRMTRVEELTGRDLSRLGDRVDLVLALHSL